jgi:membrane-bound ClpP family serine protease
MVIATQHFLRALSGMMAAVVAATGLLVAEPDLRAQEARGQDAAAPKHDGLFISVPPEITSGAVNQIKTKVKEAVRRRTTDHRGEAAAFTVVFDFNPNDLPNQTSSFGACMDLAEFIRDLRLGQVDTSYPKIKTVAFVHNKVSRHSVLPALACGELVMSNALSPGKLSPKARIGDVLGDQGSLGQEKQGLYESINPAYPRALVLRLIYPDLEVRKVKTPDGIRYWTEKEVEKHRLDGDRFEVKESVPRGREGLIDWELGREIGLCSKESFQTREELAQAYRLPRSSLSEDWLLGRTQVTWRIELRGQLNDGKVESLGRRLDDAIRGQANLIFLQLECEGGETVDAPSMARRLRTLMDQNGMPMKTVAYVPSKKALGAATVLALGCNEIVMAPDAVLGDFNYLTDKSPAAVKPKRDTLVTLAREQGYPPLLFEAMLDAGLVLHRVQSRTDPSDHRVISDAELNKDAQLAVPRWVPAGRIEKPQGEFLKLDARLAKEFGVALYADVDSIEALYAKYGLEAQKVRVAGDGWLEKAAEFFRDPIVKVILIMLGIIGLILEMKMPGVGVPGIVSAICFVLFFWAHSFESQFTVLAVLLFVLGLILIGIEVFILPGFGVTGVSGILLVVVSLALVTLQKMPTTTHDWLSLGGTLATFGVGMGSAIVFAFIAAWYLPHIPYANRLVLSPPGEENIPTTTGTEDSAAHASFLGAIGVAATTLRPAGKARFGDDFLDVIAEGDYVDPGSRVQVIEIEGNRIVVKQV